MGRDQSLIDDLPVVTKDDMFGGHQKVATAVARLLETDNRSLVVGLEGDLGSGKSSVVRMIRSKLMGGSIYVPVIVFDAWAHSGDQLRRAFFETVLEGLKQEKGRDGKEEKPWIEVDEWEQTVRDLDERPITNKVKNWTEFTSFGKRVAVSLLAVPIGMKLFEIGVGKIFGPELNVPDLVLAWAVFIIGVLLMFAPLLVYFWGTLTLGHSNESNEEKEQALSFLFNKGGGRQVETARGTPETTSLLLQKKFEELLKQGLEERDRRLVIVIDNLDRLEPDDAIQAWSTIQTFLEEKIRIADEDWTQRYSILIPYDRCVLAKHWQHKSDGGAEGLPNEENLKKASLLFEKIFDARFQVPPVLIVDWKKYLWTLMSKHLPGEKTTEKDKIFRLLERVHTVETPTPRVLKKFINSLVVLRLVHNDETVNAFSLPVLAAYVLDSENYPNFRKSLVSGEIPTEKIATALVMGVDELAREYAALHFYTDRETAYQMLLTNPLEKALKSGDHEAVKELSTTPGYQEVLETLLPRLLGYDTSANHFCHIVHALFSDEPAEHKSYKQFVYCFHEGMSRWEKINVENAKKFGEGVGKIYANTSSKKQQNEAREIPQKYIVNWEAANIVQFLDGFRKFGDVKDFAMVLDIDSNKAAACYVEIMCLDNSLELLKACNFKQSLEEVQKGLVAVSPDSGLLWEAFESLGVLINEKSLVFCLNKMVERDIKDVRLLQRIWQVRQQYHLVQDLIHQMVHDDRMFRLLGTGQDKFSALFIALIFLQESEEGYGLISMRFHEYDTIAQGLDPIFAPLETLKPAIYSVTADKELFNECIVDFDKKKILDNLEKQNIDEGQMSRAREFFGEGIHTI